MRRSENFLVGGTEVVQTSPFDLKCPYPGYLGRHSDAAELF